MTTRGVDVTAAYSLFQVRGGGSIPTTPHNFRVEECRFKDIRHIFEEFHYKGGHMGGGITTCLALLDEDRNIVGGSVLGKLRQEKAYDKLGRTIEIRRMACLDSSPKNSESYFLSKVIWFIKKRDLADVVISYADQSVGHKGTIYKAANFKLIGETAPSIHVFFEGRRYHPRSLTIERPYSHRMRAAVKDGTAQIVKGESKLIYQYSLTHA